MQIHLLNKQEKAQNFSPIFKLKAVVFLMILKTYECVVYNCNTKVTSDGIADLRTFNIGDEVTFCAHFLPLNIKASFTVNVDKYQAVTLRRNFEVVKSVNTDLSFQISNSNTLSQQVVSSKALY